MTEKRAGPPLSLPERRDTGRTYGGARTTLRVRLRTATPVLGGGTITRDVDRVDIIRVPTIRGHLRTWWRALVGPECQDPVELSRRERELWGGAGGEQGTRSPVEVRVDVTHRARELGAEGIDSNDIPPANPMCYALWPARGTRGQPAAPRRRPGTVFELEVRCPSDRAREVRGAICAWIIFGGYGSRVRRGAGSLTVDDTETAAQWLPKQATREALFQVFDLGRDPLAPRADLALRDLPLLAGARLLVGERGSKEPVTSWTTALGWLQKFRQGAARRPDENRHSAREAGATAERPGRSNWPEADKVRRLAGDGPWAHPPRHGTVPAWPRAGFGLPILGRFQTRTRQSGSYPVREPDQFELRWVDTKGLEHDRLASPLILKAFPLADGMFVPCALWLERGYPRDSKVVLRGPRRGSSGADFDQLVAPGDTPLFSALADVNAPPGRRLRTAFLRWLLTQGTQEL